MALKRPRHRVDAPIVFIAPPPEGDEPGEDAWMVDLIEQEKSAMKKAGEDPDQHPVSVYFSGDTRFDMLAPTKVLGEEKCAADYLDESKSPVRFKLQRLTYDQHVDVHTLIRQNNWLRAQVLAFEYGLADIEGCNWLKCEKMGARVSPKTKELISEIDRRLPEQIGLAVILASQSLTEAEGKP